MLQQTDAPSNGRHATHDSRTSILGGRPPAMHVHYQERLMDVPDTLPRFSDLPGESGGSGETLN